MSLYGIDSDYVDWRQFIVCVAQPWSLPSAQDLLDAKEQFFSQISTGPDSDGVSNRLVLNREQFMAADIWLTRRQPQQQQSDGVEGGGVRLGKTRNIKQVMVVKSTRMRL